MDNAEYPSSKIGVILCECGKNINEKINLKLIENKIIENPLVSKVLTSNLACSDEGREAIKQTITQEHLDRLVFAGCSHKIQGYFFEELAQECGINKYLCEIANIREQCSWVHSNIDTATDKALKIINIAVERVATNEPLEPLSFKINKDVLVIGGGITGIQAGITISERGYNAIIVENKPTVGGNLASMAKVAPSLECSACILMGKARDLPKLQVLTNSQILDIKGNYGNFQVKIKKIPRFIDEKKCTNCGACSFACLVSVPNEFEGGLSERKAIYLPYPHSYPLSHVIDSKNCNKCKDCIEACEENAIDFDQEEEILDLKVGAVIVAVGSKVNLEGLDKFGHGQSNRILDLLQFERLLAESGPSFGEVVDFATAEPYKKVAFIMTPFDIETGFKPMENLAKQVLLYKKSVPDGEVNIISPNLKRIKEKEKEVIDKINSETNINFIAGHLLEIQDGQNKLAIKYSSNPSNEEKELEAELAVISNGILPNKLPELGAKLSLETDRNGFLHETIPNIGITVAGSCAGTSSFEECLREGERAGLISIGLLNEDEQKLEPMIASINTELCSGCGICEPLCPYGALEIKDELFEVDQTLCRGCGTCVSACPSGAAEIKNMKDTQFFKIIQRAVGR